MIGLLSLAAFVILTLAASTAAAAESAATAPAAGPAAAVEPAAAAPAAAPSDLGGESTSAVVADAPVEPTPPVATPVATPEAPTPAPAPSGTQAVTSAPKASAASAPTADVPTPKVHGSASQSMPDTAESTANTVEGNRDAPPGGGAQQPPKGLDETVLPPQRPAGLDPPEQSADELLSTAQAFPAKLPSIGGLTIPGIVLTLPSDIADGILGAALALVPTNGTRGPSPSLTPSGPTDFRSALFTSPADPISANDALLPSSLVSASNQTTLATASAPELTSGSDSGSVPGPSVPQPSPGVGAGGFTGGPALILLLGLLAVFVIGIRSLGQRLATALACWRPVPFVSLLERPG